MIRNAILSIPILFLCTGVAAASGAVSCVSENEEVEILIGVGHVPIYSPIHVHARYGEVLWSTQPENGVMAIGGSQGLFEDERFAADFVDGNYEKIIISVRVDSSRENDDGSYPGTMTFEDGVPHSVQCFFE